MKTYSYNIHDDMDIDTKNILAEVDLSKSPDDYGNNDMDIDTKNILAEVDLFKLPDDCDNDTNYKKIKSDNPYIEMLERIKEKNNNLIKEIEEQINKNEKFFDEFQEILASVIIGSIFISATASIFLNPIFLGVIPISITGFIVKRKKLKIKDAFLHCKHNLLNQYNEIITTKINIFKKIDSLNLNKDYDINKIVDGELQHNYNLDKIYNLKITDSYEDYQNINKLLEKAKIENTVYLDFFKSKDIENKKQLSDTFISKEKQNLLENNEQKQINTLEMPKEPIGFTIEPIDNEETKTYQKTKKFPN